VKNSPKIQFLFIDDSGDVGLKPTSSSRFLIAAVLVTDILTRDEIALVIRKFRESLGWHELHEFKFNSARKDIVLNLLNLVKIFDFQIFAMVVDKKKFTKKSGGKMPLYNFAIAQLLRKIAPENCEICIDGRDNKKYLRETRTYFRQSLPDKTAKIQFVDSRKNDLIQLADVVAGAISRSLSEKGDAKKYVKIIRDKIKETYEL